ncbi:hypothetical protein RC62_4253 [Flavobacterium aquidurense]|uniref:Uncharacterized protein n=1 Tax=Flavobacterium aquidurense TaxID=362413 RepID=A0A0Q0WX67_9FLAO|nr:hypothetical protein RC62_4253 [Flavobacterium aquidurense]
MTKNIDKAIKKIRTNPRFRVSESVSSASHPAILEIFKRIKTKKIPNPNSKIGIWDFLNIII